MLKLLLKNLYLKAIHFANLYLWDTQDPEISVSLPPMGTATACGGCQCILNN